MNTVSMSIYTDAKLKEETEAILAQLGLTINGAINMFFMQIVRERTVPLKLSLNPRQNVYADILAAQTERASGYQGRDIDELLQDMDRIIGMVQ
ncbi:MAG: type II toxin-antitoxin system RelB/DinJ family antitoxin [Oscillospiraceae bacterium]|nr:type II toxin-antitoxin system RelB/DinJ family antitoxin [Oscillospiraceae bacterium]